MRLGGNLVESTQAPLANFCGHSADLYYGASRYQGGQQLVPSVHKSYNNELKLQP